MIDVAARLGGLRFLGKAVAQGIICLSGLVDRKLDRRLSGR
jgi:hypothetical protein